MKMRLKMRKKMKAHEDEGTVDEGGAGVSPGLGGDGGTECGDAGGAKGTLRDLTSTKASHTNGQSCGSLGVPKSIF